MIIKTNRLPLSQQQSHTTIWGHRNFLILFFTSGIIAFGNKIYELALPLILYDLTQSAVAMSTMRGIEFLPNLLLAVFIGVLVDRVHKKNWSLASILLQMLVLLGLYAALAYSEPSLYVLYAGGFLLMSFGYAFSNARVAIVKQAIPTELLTSANVSLNFITTLIGIIGPVLTGLMLMLPRLHDGLFVTAVAFGFAFILLLFLKSNEQPRAQRHTSFWKELLEGWRELRRNRLLWLITLTVIFLNCASGMVDTTVIFYAKDALLLSNFELGLVWSAAGVGGLLGSFIISWLRRRLKVGTLITLTTLCLALTYLMMYLSHSAIMLGASLFLNGWFETISVVCIWTFRQETTPQHLIGRISGITGSLFKLGMPFAIAAAGWISVFTAPSIVFLVAMLINLILFVCCRFSPLWEKQQSVL
ncbi:Na+/melibiose symporter [Paenibacillus algorifonticola]|uniref:Na+/melibiose symporter n=1 Tax=Paenibacillus algorifonticola TaxID=684063 RepID=A0A1I2FLL6_9BACL|nr:MFS transporter [Paenibacillus algorifonticola]SFF05500.1 Na+/melibiose symporter [Paenibacillus algorifonticola]